MVCGHFFLSPPLLTRVQDPPRPLGGAYRYPGFGCPRFRFPPALGTDPLFSADQTTVVVRFKPTSEFQPNTMWFFYLRFPFPSRFIADNMPQVFSVLVIFFLMGSPVD